MRPELAWKKVMRDCPRICRYLHVPAQSGSNRILKLMNRGYSVEEFGTIAINARRWAALNERALLREPITIPTSGPFIGL